MTTPLFKPNKTKTCRPSHGVKNVNFARKQAKFKDIHEAYKSLDLKLYVIRRAHAKSSLDRKKLQDEADQVCNSQEALLQNVEAQDIRSLEDALICFDIWHMETIGTKKSYELTPTDKILLKIYHYLSEQKK